MALDVPTLKYPLEVRNGEFVMVEQDSQADLDGSVEVVARCPRGWLDSRPEMGVADYVLTRGAPDPAEIRAGIVPYEPRAAALTDSELVDRVATITIDPGAVTDGQ